MRGHCLLTPADLLVLRRLVGEPTFERGLAYARQGAVRRVRWTEDGACAFGEVQGGAPSPYGVTAILRRSTAGPPGGASTPSAPARSRSTASTPWPSCWPTGPAAGPGHGPGAGSPAGGSRGHQAPEAAAGGRPPCRRSCLSAGHRGPGRRSHLGPAGRDRTPVRTGPDPAQDGAGRQPRPRGSGSDRCCAAAAGTGCAPASPGRTSTTSPIRRSVHGPLPAHLTLLTELLALSRVASRRSGLQLVGRGRLAPDHQQPAPVGPAGRGPRPRACPCSTAGAMRCPSTSGPGPASVALDATRSTPASNCGPGSPCRRRRRPPGDVAADRPAGPRHRLVGRSGRRRRPEPRPDSAWPPSPRPVDEGLRRFLASTPLRVPPARRGAVPARLLSPVAATDRRAVERRIGRPPGATSGRHLPHLTHADGHRLELSGPGGRRARAERGLWEAPTGTRTPPGRRRHHRGGDGGGRFRARVGREHLFGERLAPEAVLHGMAAVTFVTDLLPALCRPSTV